LLALFLQCGPFGDAATTPFTCPSRAIAVAMIGRGQDPSEALAPRKRAWQESLEHRTFAFRADEADLIFALSQFSGDCQVHMIHDPKKWSRLTFKFVRDGSELLAIEAHRNSTFRTVGNILYFPHFWPSSTGCTVAAYDLTTGKKLWETKLNAMGYPGHSAYRNEVTIGVGKVEGIDKAGEGSVSVYGHETFGDYIEVLDQKTGTLLAHKIYRKGFGERKNKRVK
jgi:hypothetical protein